MAKTKRQDLKTLTHISLLLAIMIILAVTPIGYITIGTLSITIIHIPVIIGAITLGMKAGTVLGGCFGITSILVATFRSPTPADQLFSPFLSGNPLSFVMAFVPRILCGIMAALIYSAVLKAFKKNTIAAAVAGAVASLTNTVLVLSFLYLFFGKIYSELTGIAYNTLMGLFLISGATNGVVEMLAAAAISALLIKPLTTIMNKG